MYYNNKRIGKTYEEMMQKAHEIEGERLYELPEEVKEEFDQTFPDVQGQYPKIAMTVVPLDTEEDRVLPGVSGVLVKYEVRFDKIPQWKVKERKYIVNGYVSKGNGTMQVILINSFENIVGGYGYGWQHIKKKFCEAADALAMEFEKYSTCPQEEQLGEVWTPFADQVNLYEVWSVYNDFKQSKAMTFKLEKCRCPSISAFINYYEFGGFWCVYQGVVAGIIAYYSNDYSKAGVFFLENEWRPGTKVSRSAVAGVPLTVLTIMNSILKKYEILRDKGLNFLVNKDDRIYSLKEWRKN